MSDAGWAAMMANAERWLAVRFADLHPRVGARKMTVPALILHGQTDRMSPVSEGREMAKLWPGARLSEFLTAADELAGYGLSTTVADARFAKPLDMDLVRQLAKSHEVLLTVEEGSSGGFGAQVLHALAADGLLDHGLKVRTLTLPDRFIEQNKPQVMYAEAGLDARGIVTAVFAALGKELRASDSARLA